MPIFNLINVFCVDSFRGFGKLKIFKKSKKKLDRAQPTHPPPYQFIFIFGNPSVTRPEHSNHNGFYQLLITYIQTECTTLRSYHMLT